MSGARPFGIGVIGLGFMGERHIRAWRGAHAAGHACRVVAVHDADPARASDPALGLDGARVHREVASLLADPAVEVVSICTHTESHVELALAALSAGKHALVEKPVAIRAPEVARLAAAARAAKPICMPAMCVRFWPGWDWLAERIRDRSFGAVRSAAFQRLGARPAWGGGFYDDMARSGGALIDFHIHDADLIRWTLGAPASVSCTGSLEHVTTQYRFTNGPAHVTAEAGWTPHPKAPFRMRYLVSFERATAEFEIGRTPALMVYDDGGARSIDLPPITGYDGQARALLAVLEGRAGAPPLPTMDEALAVAEMLDLERESLRSGAWMPV